MILAINGISYAMLLFIMAAGLTLILGVMGILNLAHGSLYILGTLFAITIIQHTDNFLVALLGGAVGVAVIGLLIQRFLLSRIPNLHTPQVLLTFGLVLIFSELSIMFWGGQARLLSRPGFLSSSIQLGTTAFPSYRLALIVAGGIIAILLWLFLEKTKWGAILRAGKDNAEMSEAIGINVPLVFGVVFGIGGFLAGLAGVLGGPIVGFYPEVEWQVLILALVVVVIGGLGSLKGAFIASMFVGLMDNFGRAYFPELAMFLIFLPMAIILAVRPAGLFGRT